VIRRPEEVSQVTRTRAPQGRPDRELLELAQSEPASDRGREAASDLLERYQGRVYLWCLRYVRDHDRALDLAQDVLIKAYRALPGFRGAAQFSSWLFTIARHRCLNAVRPVSWMRDEGLDLDLVPDESTPPDAVIEEAESEALLEALIEECLDETERKALFLRTSERMSVDEITTLLGIDQRSGARGVLQAARRKLRAALDRKENRERG
jgi:RNA polymerase sigma-70 factor (ECF subfamily)